MRVGISGSNCLTEKIYKSIFFCTMQCFIKAKKQVYNIFLLKELKKLELN